MRSANCTHAESIYVSIGKHHRWVVLIQGVPADGADESGVGAVRVGQRVSKVVQVSTAHWAVAVALNRVLFVTVTGAKVKERALNRGREKGMEKKKDTGVNSIPKTVRQDSCCHCH